MVGVLCDQLSEKLESQGSNLTLEEAMELARKAESRAEGKEILRGGRVEAMSHASYRQPRQQHTPKRELSKCANCRGGKPALNNAVALFFFQTALKNKNSRYFFSPEF